MECLVVMQSVAFFYKKEPVEPHVNECLKMQTYVACYEPMVMPMNGPDKWEDTGFEPVGPPHKQRPPSRPKKRRKRDVDEQRPQSSKLSRNLVMKCQYCKEVVHNKRTCKGKVGGNQKQPTSQQQSNFI